MRTSKFSKTMSKERRCRTVVQFISELKDGGG